MSWERKKAIRDAHDANKVVTYNGDRVYADGICVYDPDAIDPDDVVPDEVMARIWMYGEALKELSAEQRKFSPNYNLWFRWNTETRLWWIDQIEAQAQAGKQTLGVEVVARAVQIRLTRTMT